MQVLRRCPLLPDDEVLLPIVSRPLRRFEAVRAAAAVGISLSGVEGLLVHRSHDADMDPVVGNFADEKEGAGHEVLFGEASRFDFRLGHELAAGLGLFRQHVARG